MAGRMKMIDCCTIRVGDCDFTRGTDGSHSLLVRVAASHSATINGNYRFYRPDKMQDGAKTWVPSKGFKKPVLIGHNEDGDVLGRVVEARYIDDSYKWAPDFPVIKDSLFYRTDSKKVGLFESVDWIVENLLDLEEYTGLGYTELGLSITNPAAIEKLNRDEFLTVSVGFSTDSAICSVCHQDWADDDRCEHKLGDDVEGKKVFLICGNLEYSEVSFVNFPADPFAGVISKQTLADSLNRTFFFGQSPKNQNSTAKEMALTDSLYDSDIHFSTEDSMAPITTLTELLAADGIQELTQEIKTSLTKERVEPIKELLNSWNPETDTLKTKKRSITSTLNAQVRKHKFDAATAPAVDAEIEQAIAPPAEGCTVDSEGECEPISMDSLPEADRAYFEDVDGLYTEMEVELDAAVAAGELTADSIKDAKLSSEKRNSLKSSTFCGPNRSFPVPDCAHVTAARRLLGRASVSEATKEKISACVSRKASSLKCGGKKDEIPTAALVTDNVKTVSEKINKFLGDKKFSDANAKLAQHFMDLDAAYDAAEDEDKNLARALLSSLQEDWYADSAVAYYTSRLQAEDGKAKLATNGFVIVDKAVVDEIPEKEEALNAVTAEKEALAKQLDAQTKAGKALLDVYKKGLAQTIVMARVMAGHEAFKDLDAAGRQTKIDELAVRHVEYLKNTVADLISELKWNAATVQAGSTAIEPGQPANDNPQIKVADSVDESTEDEEAAARAEAFVPVVLGRTDAILWKARKAYQSVRDSKSN